MSGVVDDPGGGRDDIPKKAVSQAVRAKLERGKLSKATRDTVIRDIDGQVDSTQVIQGGVAAMTLSTWVCRP